MYATMAWFPRDVLVSPREMILHPAHEAVKILNFELACIIYQLLGLQQNHSLSYTQAILPSPNLLVASPVLPPPLSFWQVQLHHPSHGAGGDELGAVKQDMKDAGRRRRWQAQPKAEQAEVRK